MGVCTVDNEKIKNNKIILKNSNVIEHYKNEISNKDENNKSSIIKTINNSETLNDKAGGNGKKITKNLEIESPKISYNNIIPSESVVDEYIAIEQIMIDESPKLYEERSQDKLMDNIIEDEKDNEEKMRYNNAIEPIKKYKNTKTLKGSNDRITSLIRLSSGYIATGSYDFSIKIWDITKEPEDSLISKKNSLGTPFCLLELKPNELLAGNSMNCIDIFDLNDDSDKIKNSLFEHWLWITALVKCEENNFASASNDARIIIWDSNNKKKLRELKGHTGCILTMILLENCNLCSGGIDESIIIWDWKKGRNISNFKGHDGFLKTICQFNDEILLTGSNDKNIKIWNMNLIQIGELKGHEDSVRTLCKIDGNYFASGSFDNTIKIWDFNKKNALIV